MNSVINNKGEERDNNNTLIDHAIKELSKLHVSR